MLKALFAGLLRKKNTAEWLLILLINPNEQGGTSPRQRSPPAGPSSPIFLLFSSFFQKIFSNTFLTERFYKIDPGLSAIHVGVKITQLGAVNVGAKPPYHLADDAELTLTWQHLGAVQ
jgi:hypothetical protein